MDLDPVASSLQNTSPSMNPANVANLQAAYNFQSDLLQSYQEQLSKLQAVNEHLTHYIQSLTANKTKKVSISEPDKFYGTAYISRGLFVSWRFISRIMRTRTYLRRRSVLN